MNRGHFYDYTPEEPFQVTMKLALVRPDENALILESGAMGEYPQQPVWWGVDDCMSWCWGYYGSESESGDDGDEHWEMIDARAAEMGYFDAWLEYFEEYGFGAVVEQLEVKFTVVPDGWSGKVLEKSETFRLKDFDLTVEQAEFTGFSGRIHLRLSFPQPMDLSEIRWLSFDAYADGKRLELAQQMDMFGDAPVEATYDLWTQDGCALLPDEIALEVAGERVTFKLK